MNKKTCIDSLPLKELHTITKMKGSINLDSTIAESMNDNINLDSTIAESMNDNINLDSTIAESMNARS
jgi:hypothetical protein